MGSYCGRRLRIGSPSLAAGPRPRPDSDLPGHRAGTVTSPAAAEIMQAPPVSSSLFNSKLEAHNEPMLRLAPP